jgi:hypothetical protein
MNGNIMNGSIMNGNIMNGNIMNGNIMNGFAVIAIVSDISGWKYHHVIS